MSGDGPDICWDLHAQMIPAMYLTGTAAVHKEHGSWLTHGPGGITAQECAGHCRSWRACTGFHYRPAGPNAGGVVVGDGTLEYNPDHFASSGVWTDMKAQSVKGGLVPGGGAGYNSMCTLYTESLTALFKRCGKRAPQHEILNFDGKETDGIVDRERVGGGFQGIPLYKVVICNGANAAGWSLTMTSIDEWGFHGVDVMKLDPGAGPGCVKNCTIRYHEPEWMLSEHAEVVRAESKSYCFRNMKHKYAKRASKNTQTRKHTNAETNTQATTHANTQANTNSPCHGRFDLDTSGYCERIVSKKKCLTYDIGMTCRKSCCMMWNST